MEKVSTQETIISHLTTILRKMENPEVSLLELLHVICNRFPPVIFKPELENGRPMAFHLSCPCKSSHSVTHLGFLLLEKVEGTLKSAEQQVETVLLHFLSEPWLSALEARMLRQQRTVKKIEADAFPTFPAAYDEQEDMGRLLSLQQNCRRLIIGQVIVRDCLDDEGDRRRRDQDFWAKMARTLELGNLEVYTVVATRYDLQGGSWEDLRAIWDALGARADGWSIFLVTEVLFDNSYARITLAWNSQEVKEEVWKAFQLILDTPPEQWPDYLKEKLFLPD